jgi:hypothetical protein
LFIFSKDNNHMSWTKRDSKDPMPKAENVYRQNEAGNVPVTGEKHDQAKAEKISADQNRTTGKEAMAVPQPTRQNGDGNTVVTGESHDQAKAETITEDRRW